MNLNGIRRLAASVCRTTGADSRFGRTALALGVALLLAMTVAASGADPAADRPANASENLYLARRGLTREQLGEFIATAREKPESIRKRPGFHAAVVDAANRVLDQSTTDALANDEVATQAVLAKFWALHNQALAGDSQADDDLAELAAKFVKDTRPPVAATARFHALEERALAADALPPEKLTPVVGELRDYFSRETLGNRDVRLASTTVKIINRLPDDRAAAEAYKEFGGWFAKSKDPELARYGRKIEKGPKGAKPSAEGPALGPPAATPPENKKPIPPPNGDEQ